MKKTTKFIILLFTQTLFWISCEEKIPTDITKISFIPLPVSVTATGESFQLEESTPIYISSNSEELKVAGDYLANKLNEITGYSFEVTSTVRQPRKGIYLFAAEDETLQAEGYELTIEKKLITIKAREASGCFFGVQTLLQTLPLKMKSEEDLNIATGAIKDFPEYGFRSAMLDVARHFFSVEDVKRLIDLLASYKINHLHLHLTDDQGWRIEIKSWPKLATYGGSTEVGGGEGGYYTQEQYSEIVKYAQERFITIIPEIDMPGHTNAALASYAELNCNGKAKKLYTKTRVGFSSLCTDKEITYKFVDDVIRELAAITPGTYIHIGGDESQATKPDDYIYFVNKVREIVAKYDKKIIGWDEIAHADIKEGATVQYWANAKNTKMGIKKGANVIMSPAAKAYLDMKYDSTTTLGLAWAGYIEVDVGYNWNPTTLEEGITKENILGIEPPLWTETVTNIDELEYMFFPRLPGYAEIGWTSPDMRNWEEYKLRLANHGKRLEEMGVDFYKSELIPWE